MKSTFFASALIAGAAAGAIALAPVAAAESNNLECADKGTATVCQRNGHASLNASPGTKAGGSAYWPFGAGPVPPIWAMD